MKYSTFILFISLLFSGLSQKDAGESIVLSEQKYDRSYLSPALRGKHSFSLGLFNSQTTPDLQFGQNRALHIGYNYLILKQRKLVLALRDIKRTEMNSFGLHLTLASAKEHYLMGTFQNSVLAKKGRFVSVYFLSEVGLGYHYKKDLQSLGQRSLNISALLEFFRIRVGRIPLYFNISGTYAITNNLFDKTPLVMGYMSGLRYYFYRK